MASLLCGCSTTSVVDSLPASMGGLPEGTPERPSATAYPAVHDMPPARADTPLSEAEKKKLKDDLAASRDRAARRASALAAPTATQSAGTDHNP